MNYGLWSAFYVNFENTISALKISALMTSVTTTHFSFWKPVVYEMEDEDEESNFFEWFKRQDESIPLIEWDGWESIGILIVVIISSCINIICKGLIIHYTWNYAPKGRPLNALILFEQVGLNFVFVPKKVLIFSSFRFQRPFATSFFHHWTLLLSSLELQWSPSLDTMVASSTMSPYASTTTSYWSEASACASFVSFASNSQWSRYPWLCWLVFKLLIFPLEWY